MGVLPLSLWTPFDQLAHFPVYVLMYTAENMIAFININLCICMNTYINLVFICLHFNYKLVGERVENVGGPHFEIKVDVYAQMIQVIELNLKTNR